MKPLLKLVGGWAFDSRALAPLARELSATFEVEPLTPADLDRHALAWKDSASGGRYPSYHFGLRRLIERESSPVLLVGWSMGGMICIETAIECPSHVAGLVLISSTARFCSCRGYPHGFPTANLRALGRATRRDPAAALRAFTAQVAEPETSPPVVLSQSLVATSDPDPTLGAGLAYLADTDLRDGLGLVQSRTLVLHGEGDAVIPVGAARALAETLPSATLHVFPGIGHDLPARVPHDVAAAIQAWVRA